MRKYDPPVAAPVKFGPVPRGTVRITQQEFVAAQGNYELKMGKVTSDSPCIKVTLAKPGLAWECHAFTVKFVASPGLSTGQFHKHITFSYYLKKGSREQKLVVPVSAEVTPEVFAEPDLLFLGEVKSGQTASRSIMIRSNYGRPKLIVSEAPNFVELKLSPTIGGQQLEATLRPDTPKGCYESKVVLSVSKKDIPPIKVPVFVLVD